MSDLSEIAKLFVTLTPPRVALLVVILALMIVAGIAFEIHTSQLQINRLERIADVISKIDRLSSSEDEKVQELSDRLLREIGSVLEEEQNQPELPIDPRLMLALTLGIPWALIALMGVAEKFNGDEDWFYGVLGALFMGALFAFVGYSVPTDLHWFYRYLVIPLSVTLLTLVIFWAIGTFGEDDDEQRQDGT